MQQNVPVEFTLRVTYPAPPATVFGMLTTSEFLQRCCVESGARRQAVEGTPSTVSVSLEVESPAAARPLVGQLMTIQQRFSWGEPDAAAGRDGIMQLAIAGSPLTLTGTCRLRPTAQGTEVDYTGDLVAAVPLLGRRIEQLAQPEFEEGFRVTERVGRAWLTERGLATS